MSRYENDRLNQKAVALKYEGGDIAPIIVATGMGYTAERIVQSALEHDIPVYEDNSLATLLSRLELGEEIGWRGFHLWNQAEAYGEPKAVLINGLEWGLAHQPLIYFGFNYSPDNWGAPWTNMLLMLLLCLVLGILLSYVTLKTGNCMFSAIMHGAVNIIGEWPVLCTASQESGLLGPNPTGLLSMGFLIAVSIIIFIRYSHSEG